MSLCAFVYMCFVVTCWERADLLALVCGVCCEFVTFLLVSWVRCGTWLYRFLIFAPLLTLYYSYVNALKLFSSFLKFVNKIFLIWQDMQNFRKGVTVIIDHFLQNWKGGAPSKNNKQGNGGHGYNDILFERHFGEWTLFKRSMERLVPLVIRLQVCVYALPCNLKDNHLLVNLNFHGNTLSCTRHERRFY